MESKDDIVEAPLIVVEDPNSEVKEIITNEAQEPVGRATTPFKKWMNSFRVKKQPTHPPQRYVEGWPEPPSGDCDNNSLSLGYGAQDQHWERQSAHSSNLETVRTATMSIASLVRSRRTTLSAGHSAGSDMRGSMESSRSVPRPSLEDAANARSIRRWFIINELYTTETDYVFGFRALTDILATFFQVRPEIFRSIEQIREIHEEFLADLRTAMPRLDPARTGRANAAASGVQKNRSLRKRTLAGLFNNRHNASVVSPREALEVANKVGKLATPASIAIFEEFYSNYKLLTEDVYSIRGPIPNWQFYEQGIEALSKSTASMGNRLQQDHRSMTLHDLLVKPVQRVCKYPLLVLDLLEHTPTSDCPESHLGIQQALNNLKILAKRADDASEVGDQIKRTVSLQEKLDSSGSTILCGILKQLGPMTLCGVLHVTYQLPEFVTGGYMVCSLFKDCLFLATLSSDYQKLRAVACLDISNIRIDSLENGKGLRCYGCLFSWKLIFQDEDEKFELILSASSAKEEYRWKNDILKCAAELANAPKPESSEPKSYIFTTLELVPLNRPFPAGSLARKSSTHSSVASSNKQSVQHVIIKKTHCPLKLEEAAGQTGTVEIERPKIPNSLLPSPVVLVSRRQDRIRLEKLISDAFSKDELPYPGMHPGKGDLRFRPGSLMRRLTIRTGFSRRSSAWSLSNASPTSANATPEDVGTSKQDGEEDLKVEMARDQPDSSEKEALIENSPTSTVRTKQSKHKVSKSELRSDSEGDRCHESPEANLRKNATLNGIFNSFSRKSRKSHSRPRLRSGV